MLACPIESRDPVNILGWIAVGGTGESDRQVGMDRMGKMTPDMNLKLTSNLKPKVHRVVWAKWFRNRSDSSEIAQNRGGGLTGFRCLIGSA